MLSKPGWCLDGFHLISAYDLIWFQHTAIELVCSHLLPRSWMALPLKRCCLKWLFIMVFQSCLLEPITSKALVFNQAWCYTKHDQKYPQSVFIGRCAVLFLYLISPYKNCLGINLSVMLIVYPAHHSWAY